MLIASPCPSLALRDARPFRAVDRRARRWLIMIAVLTAAALAFADPLQPAAEVAPEFLPAVQLAPFVVNGKKLSVSIHARSAADRRYAERFAEEVIEVAYDTVDGAVGAGLVIMAKDGEPHPIFVFRKFLAMAKAGELDPSVAAYAPELEEMLKKWEAFFNPAKADPKEGMKLDFDQILEAIPLPLKGVGSKLYQLAWAVEFDDVRVSEMLRSLSEADLKADKLSQFNWVFYLPPRGAFNRALKKVLPVVMKQGHLGVFKRAALRSALVVFKPAVSKAMEAGRKGFMFMTVLSAQTKYTPEEIQLLTRAYVRVLMPDFKFNDGETQQRAIDAVAAQRVANAQYAKDPFVAPTPLDTYDAGEYAAFEGSYMENPKIIHRFRREADTFTWQSLESKPTTFRPAGPNLLVSEKGHMTLRFILDEKGVVTGVEERWVRRRKTIPRAPEQFSPPETKSVKG